MLVKALHLMSCAQVIPRGSNALVTHIKQNTKIPVMGHADGICHIYIDQDADLDLACKIVVDAKTDYPAACNAVEKVLVHRSLLGQIYKIQVRPLTAAIAPCFFGGFTQLASEREVQASLAYRDCPSNISCVFTHS